MHHVGKSEFQRVNTYHYFLQTITSLNSETSVTCPFPTTAAALNWTLPTTNFLSDAVNAIFFATCYSTIINLQRYGNMWYMGLLIFYSSFTHISLSSSPSAIQYSPSSSPSPSPSPLSHSLSSSLFPVALFSSHSWIWATINFLSTITDPYPSPVFFPFCSLSPLCSLGVSLVVGLGCGCDFRLWVWLWFSIVIDVGVGLWVVGLSSLFYIPVNWPSPFISSESRLFESILGAESLFSKSSKSSLPSLIRSSISVM